MTKKVGFGTTLLDKGLSGAGIDGIGQYCLELINQFKAESYGIELLPYTFGAENSKSCASVLPSYPAHILESLLNITKYSRSQKYFETVDLIHCPDQLIPIVPNKPVVATVMDTIPLSHPEFLKSHSRLLKPFAWKKLTQRADHIITISEFSKGEIVKQMEINESNITSIPLGVDLRFFEKITEHEKRNILNNLNLDRPFFLFLGSIQPRKNLLNIIGAHEQLPGNLSREFPLVVAGKIAWDNGKILSTIHQGIADKRCIWLNYVSDLEKRCLLQSTLALVFASLYEGFGLPILEAFASEATVITSNCTSMPEVAGNAAILVNPINQAEITDALKIIIQSPPDIKQLQVKGLERAKMFNWEQVAQKTKAIYSLF